MSLMSINILFSMRFLPTGQLHELGLEQKMGRILYNKK